MPRIPTVGEARPQRAQAGPQYGRLDYGNDGTGALVQGIGVAKQAIDSAAARAKARADGIAADSLLSQAQQYTTEQLHGFDETPAAEPGPAGADFLTEANIAAVGSKVHRPGYLDTRGTEAHEKSADVLEALGKKYESLLKVAGNDEQREAVRQRFATLYESVRGQVAQHEGRQLRVADVTATKGLVDTSVRSAANLYNRPDDVEALNAVALASIKRSALPEEYEAQAGEYLSRVSRARIAGYLQRGDVAGAEAQFKADEGTLGDDGWQVKARIDSARAGLDRKAAEIEDERVVSEFVEHARAKTPEAYVDENMVLAAIRAAPEDKRKEYRALGSRVLAAEAERKKNDLEGWRNSAQGYFNTGGLLAIPGELRNKIHQYDSAFEAKLIRENEERWRRAKSDTKESYAEQARLNQSAMLEYMSKPLVERVGINVDTEFLGSGADEKLGLKAIRAQQTKDKAAVEKGEAVGESAFVTNAKSAGAGLVAPKGMDAKEFEAEAHLAYSDFFEKNKRKPNEKESKELITDVLLNQTSRPGALNRLTGGLIPTTTEQLGYKARAAERKAAAKALPAERTMKFDEGLDLTKPSRKDRALQLKGEGKTNAEIAAALNAEGY